MVSINLFMKAMDGVWTVKSYKVLDDGRVEVTYFSNNTGLEWSHKPFRYGPMDLPKLGSTGRLGFITTNEVVETTSTER